MTTDVSLLPDRLLEQTEVWTPWDRRAWEPGTILRLKELSEATVWASKGVLSDGAISWLQNSLKPLIGHDPGLGTGSVKSQLADLLKGKLVFESQAQRQLDQLVAFTEASYLRRWRDVLDSEPSKVHVERASRHISSHVIDAGYHPEWLRALIRGLVADGASPSDLVDEFMGLLGAPEQVFSGFVAMESVPALPLMSKLMAGFLRMTSQACSGSTGTMPPCDKWAASDSTSARATFVPQPLRGSPVGATCQSNSLQTRPRSPSVSPALLRGWRWCYFAQRRPATNQRALTREDWRLVLRESDG